MTNAAHKTIEAWGREYAPQVGSCVQADAWKMGVLLEAGDEYVDSGYAGSDFRVTHYSGATCGVNVEITGRTPRKHNGEWAVRVRITFVGDCEENTTAGGFMTLHETSQL